MRESFPDHFPAEGFILENPSTGEVIRTQEEYDADIKHMAEVAERHMGRLDLPSTNDIIEDMMLDAQVVTFSEEEED